MILDRIQNAAQYGPVPPGLDQALRFLAQTDLTKLALGRHAIAGDRLYAIVAKDDGRGHERARLEAHRRYIDIQYVVSGTEEIGWRSCASCASIATPYDPAKDVMFFGDTPETWLILPAGHFAVFFPDDAHAPLAGRSVVHKVVVKVAVEKP
jgi:YhcH/YjgK/YiaL family protein